MIGHAFIAGLLSGSPGEPVTFDPTDKGADVALSGGNLTATWSQVSGYQSVRTASAKAVGKFYIELNCGAQVEAGVWRAADYAATGASVSGGATGAIGFNLTGSAAQIAIDLDRKLYWRRNSNARSFALDGRFGGGSDRRDAASARLFHTPLTCETDKQQPTRTAMA